MPYEQPTLNTLRIFFWGKQDYLYGTVAIQTRGGSSHSLFLKLTKNTCTKITETVVYQQKVNIGSAVENVMAAASTFSSGNLTKRVDACVQNSVGYS
jgi:hypothetical protein